jgi:hypothetical protein
VHALRNIHSTLSPGGLLVDTQPVGSQPRVAVNGVAVGKLDMLEWTNTIAAIDSLVAEVLDNGLFEIDYEEGLLLPTLSTTAMSVWPPSLPGAIRASRLASSASLTLRKQQSRLNRTFACACSARRLQPEKPVDSPSRSHGP